MRGLAECLAFQGWCLHQVATTKSNHHDSQGVCNTKQLHCAFLSSVDSACFVVTLNKPSCRSKKKRWSGGVICHEHTKFSNNESMPLLSSHHILLALGAEARMRQLLCTYIFWPVRLLHKLASHKRINPLFPCSFTTNLPYLSKNEVISSLSFRSCAEIIFVFHEGADKKCSWDTCTWCCNPLCRFDSMQYEVCGICNTAC